MAEHGFEKGEGDKRDAIHCPVVPHLPLENLRTRDGLLQYSPAMIVAKTQTSARAADAPRRAMVLSVLSQRTHSRSAPADHAIYSSRRTKYCCRCEEGHAETVPIRPEMECGEVSRVVWEEERRHVGVRVRKVGEEW